MLSVFRIAMGGLRLCVLSMIVILSAAFRSPAKIRADRTRFHLSDVRTSSVPRDAGGIRELEERLRPYFERKISSDNRAERSHSFRESDFLALARLWDNLSPGFKKLYVQATQIPDNFIYYISPGGNFEVFYTATGNNAVNATDTYAYGNLGDWRSKIAAANGVPDYVDEVAWALDSSWSMAIDRFGFAKPFPYKDTNHPSDRYKVVIVAPRYASFYGMTYVQEKNTSSNKGYRSYIEINNDWHSSVWSELGYDKSPELAVRVTTAHEFMHAIQYAMSYNVISDIYLDNFPITWIEGTAVLMEELAFDDINDYLQYTTEYFDDPGMSFFGELYDGVTEYTNGILTKYLYEYAAGSHRIDFIKRIFDNNYQKAQLFHPGLRATAQSMGKTWSGILNDFHTGSYFAGQRADTTRFLADSRLYKEWSFSFDQPDFTNTVRKHVNPYGMQTFAIKPEPSHSDTLALFFSGQLDISDTISDPWAVSAILRRSSKADSVIKMSPTGPGAASLTIPGWKNISELILVATNGYPGYYAGASVFYQICPITYMATEMLSFHATALDASARAHVALRAISDLRCSLTLSESLDTSILEPSLMSDLKPISARFAVEYPHTWGDSASLQFSLSMLRAALSAATDPDSTSLYCLSSDYYSWQKVATQVKPSADSISWQTALSKPGVYGVFIGTKSPRDTTPLKPPALVIFPNPARISAQRQMYFEGDDILQIRIFSSEGSLVAHEITSGPAVRMPFERYTRKTRNGVAWQLKNNAGKKVIPGLYVAFVGYKDPVTRGMKTIRHNVMVFP